MTSTTRILLVRAVNVGGAKLPMAEFRAMLEALGATSVRTYIASGNAVLDLPSASDPTAAADGRAFDRAVERTLRERYGYVREVVSRSPSEARRALAAHPFEVVEPKYSYVVFLTVEPDADGIDAASTVPTGDDEWRLIGRELHVRFVNGAGRPSLDLDRVLRRLGVAGTARNLRTVQALIDLASVG